MNTHAKLSASGSHRWIRCPGSIKAEENLPDTKNKYANEGTLAHEVASKILQSESIDDIEVTSEMKDNIQIYIDYIKEISQSTYYPEIMIEKEVNFSHIVPGGFGTADAVIINNNTLHIVDFKYGVGHLVNVYENTQLLLYASGAYNELKNKDYINCISLHIVQPRINHFDKWELSIKELSFHEGYLKAKAEEALRENAPRIPSEIACKWCKANTTCPALYNFAEQVIEYKEEVNSDNIKMKYLLDNSKMIKNLLNNIEDEVFEKLRLGYSFPGYKLVEGRKIRKIKTNISNKLFELLGEKAYVKSTIGVKELEKLVDNETLKSFIYTSNCKPLLVSKNDKRKALTPEELNFDAVEEEDTILS